MVIALLDGESVTLKKLYREGGGKVRLQPANSRMKPIFVDQDDLRVQGVVIGVLRQVLTVDLPAPGLPTRRLSAEAFPWKRKKSVNFTIVPRRGLDRPARLQQLLLDPELALRLHPHLLRDAADRRARAPGGPGDATSSRRPSGAHGGPVQMIPGLIAALQENFRLYQESFGPPKGPLH